VLGIFLGLSVVTAVVGLGVKAWAPGFDIQVLEAVAAHRTAGWTSVAEVVTDAGSFVLLAPLSIAFVLLRRWKRPADDIALVVIAAGSAALPSVTKLIVARPRPIIEPLSHLTSLSFPSEHSTQAAAIYLTIAILLSAALNRGWRRVLIVLAVLIALSVAGSRVSLGIHYPTDVIAGLLLGWTWALLVFHWARPKLVGRELSRSVGKTVTAANSVATT
jgi:membrane-associated phospholipid phosphatase